MKKVLIIDDEEDLCTVLMMALAKDMYAVDCVHTLRDAGIKLKGATPDIILLDNNLPDGSGLEYFHSNRKKFRQSAVVFITADPAPDIHERADLSGVAAFIRKPFTAGVLKDTIKHLV